MIYIVFKLFLILRNSLYLPTEKGSCALKLYFIIMSIPIIEIVSIINDNLFLVTFFFFSSN